MCLHQIEPIKYQCCPHIEISQLICTVNQLTGFYMWTTLAFNGLTRIIANPNNQLILCIFKNMNYETHRHTHCFD